MEATFIELPAFSRHRADYLSDEAFRSLQQLMMLNPYCGDVIQHTGGLRKVRVGDEQRHKGKRGGTRIIYYWWQQQAQFLLFTLYSKGEMDDLTMAQRTMLCRHLEQLTAGG